jgi:lipopolysaccharide/colanic/teichoic acid biosynthesis glycosyltransferase
MKRLLDIVYASFTLVVMSPVMVWVAIKVYGHDHGPVFFRQRRVGRGGREFGMLKFRSMVIDADKLGGYSTAEGDPRITPIGGFIRRTSLDELPQVINVLLGDMSIVGPRPDVPAQRTLYSEEEWTLRHTVRPGITGLAQAGLRSDLTADERKQLDLQYARAAGVWLDFKIIGATFRQVFGKSSKGSY